MKITLQLCAASYSAVAAALAHGAEASINIGMSSDPEKQLVAQLFAVSFSTNLHEDNTRFALKATDAGRLYLDQFGELPPNIKEYADKHGIPDDGLPLVPTDIEKQWGLGAFGLTGAADLDVTDEQLAAMVAEDQPTPVSDNNAIPNYGDPESEGLSRVDGTIFSNSDIEITVDARYQLAAYQRFLAGHSMRVFNRETQRIEVVSRETPNVNAKAQVTASKMLPMQLFIRDEQAVSNAQHYYEDAEALSELLHQFNLEGLQHCIPLTQLNMQLLRDYEHPLTLVALIDDTKLGQFATFSATPKTDSMNGGFLEVSSLGGADEEGNYPGIADTYLSGHQQSPFVITDAGAIDFLKAKGYEAINFVDIIDASRPQ